jgi:putative tryptophan/tyrosine transport system substrate-binding protein
MVFATLLKLNAGALVIGTDPFLNTRSEQLAALAIRHAVPTIYQYRAFGAAGEPRPGHDFIGCNA